MSDLFTLNDDTEHGSTETSNLFGKLSENVNVVAPNANNQNIQGSNGATINKNDNSVTGTRKSSKKKDKEKIEESEEGEGDETNILKSLFDAQGIHVSPSSFPPFTKHKFIFIYIKKKFMYLLKYN